MNRPRKDSDNIDERTVASFADEWSHYDQSTVGDDEMQRIFGSYFDIFPWENLPPACRGFDMGCGSGRWARLVAGRVSHLALVDVSETTLDVARKNLAGVTNVEFLRGTADNSPLAPGSQDFGYSLGVLHHIPDTARALCACVELLKPGAPFLLYLYYRFDNRPAWFVALWRISEFMRSGISKLPSRAKRLVTDAIALLVYWPLARVAGLAVKTGINARHFPLYEYRDCSFYTMRTDSRDRFGTPLEQRFTREEIHDMMVAAGLDDIRFSDTEPFWCAVGIRRAT